MTIADGLCTPFAEDVEEPLVVVDEALIGGGGDGS